MFKYTFGVIVSALIGFTLCSCGSPDFKYQNDEAIRSLTAVRQR